MTKPTVAKRVPTVILLGKVVVIQAAPATLKILELLPKQGSAVLGSLALMTVYHHAGRERATCKVQKPLNNVRQQPLRATASRCLIQFSATKA